MFYSIYVSIFNIKDVSMKEKDLSKAKGGLATARKLSPKQLSERAKKAAVARWSETSLTAKRSSNLLIGELKIPCYVLSNSARVLSGRGIMKLLGFDAKSTGSILRNMFKNNALTQYVSSETLDILENPISFERPGAGGSAPDTYAYEATILIDICKAILEAKRQDALESEIHLSMAVQAEIIVTAVAKVGIIALIDEATGFQEERPQDALQAYLEQLISKELAAWVKKFPDEFYENIYKLRGWTWTGMSKNRYSVVAIYTNDLVYQRLAPNILPELEKRSPKNEKGNRTNKLHQWLTSDIGNPMLAQHMHSLIMFQRLAISSGYGWKRFVKMLDQVMPKKGNNLELPLDDTDSNY